MKPTKPLKPVEEALVLSLACGSTVEAAAQKAGVSIRTVYRKLEDREFKLKLKEFRSELVKRTAALLSAASLEAVKTLLALMESNTAPSTRLGAARSVLELGLRMRDVVDIEERVAIMEKVIYEPTAREPGERA